jgi:hypothetical protein
MNTWLTARASVTGASHLQAGTECQDSNAIIVSENNKWLIAVVSDGAGSAARSKEGSELTVEVFSNALQSVALELDKRPPGHWINDLVITKVIKVREELSLLAGGDNLKDFHCTLLAVLIGAQGGFSIHLGDGAIIGGRTAGIKVPEDLFTENNIYISPPENGEYSNETFFITEGNWVKHLRITPLPSLDWVFLGTDGATALAMDGDIIPRDKFIIPVIKNVFYFDSENLRNSALEKILSDTKASKITGDDKTIVLAIRPSVLTSFSVFNIGSHTDQKKLLEPEKNHGNYENEEPIVRDELIKTKSKHNKPHFKILRIKRRYLVLIAITVTLIVSITLTYIFNKDLNLSLSTQFISQMQKLIIKFKW